MPEAVEPSEEEAALAAGDPEGRFSAWGSEAGPFGGVSARTTSAVSKLAEGRRLAGALGQAPSLGHGGHGARHGPRAAEASVGGWLRSRPPAACPHGRSICHPIPLKETARKLDRH